MAQNVTIPGGSNTKGHATTQGVTKPRATSSPVSSAASGQPTHEQTEAFVDGRQQTHKQGQQA